MKQAHNITEKWQTTDIRYQYVNSIVVFSHAFFIIYTLFLNPNSSLGISTLSTITLGLWSLAILSMVYMFKTLIVQSALMFLQFTFPIWVIFAVSSIRFHSHLLLAGTALISCIYICLSIVNGSIIDTGAPPLDKPDQSDSITSPLSAALLMLSIASAINLALLYSQEPALVVSSTLMLSGIVGTFLLYYFRDRFNHNYSDIHCTKLNLKLIYFQIIQPKTVFYMVAISLLSAFLYTSKTGLKQNLTNTTEFMSVLTILFASVFLAHGLMKRLSFSNIRPYQLFSYSALCIAMVATVLIITLSSSQPFPIHNLSATTLLGLASGMLIGLHFPYVKKKVEPSDLFLRVATVSFATILSIAITSMTLKFVLPVSVWLLILSLLLLTQVMRLLFKSTRNICSNIIYKLLKCFYKIDIVGLDSIKNAPCPFLIIANHRSYLDVAAIGSTIEKCKSFPIYPELLKWECVKKATRYMDITVFPLSTHNPSQLKSVINSLKSGNTCLIFPEGRISYDGHMAKIYSGTNLLIEKANIPIVPIFFENSESSCFGRAQTCWFPKLRLYIGKPTTKEELFPNVNVSQKRLFKNNQIANAITTSMLSQNTHLHLFDYLHENLHQHKQHSILLQDNFGNHMDYKQLFGLTNRLSAHLKNHTTQTLPWLLVLPNSNLRTACVLAALSLNQTIIEVHPEKLDQFIIYLKQQSLKLTVLLPPDEYASNLDLSQQSQLKDEDINIVQLPNFTQATFKNSRLNQHNLSKNNAQQTAIITASYNDKTDTFDCFAYSHEQVITNIKATALTCHIGKGDKIYHAASIGTSFQSIIATLLPVTLGIPTALHSTNLSPTHVVENIYDYAPSILFAESELIKFCVTLDQPYSLYSLKQAIFPAGELDTSIELAWKKRFSILWASYVSTAQCPMIACQTPHHNNFGLLGKILDSIKIEINEENNTTRLSGYTIGEPIALNQPPTSIKPMQTTTLPSNISIIDFDYLKATESN